MKKAEILEELHKKKLLVKHGTVILDDPVAFYDWVVKELKDLEPEPQPIEDLKCWICGRSPIVDGYDELYRFVTYHTEDKKISKGLECRKHAEGL